MNSAGQIAPMCHALLSEYDEKTVRDCNRLKISCDVQNPDISGSYSLCIDYTNDEGKPAKQCRSDGNTQILCENDAVYLAKFAAIMEGRTAEHRDRAVKKAATKLASPATQLEPKKCDEGKCFVRKLSDTNFRPKATLDKNERTDTLLLVINYAKHAISIDITYTLYLTDDRASLVFEYKALEGEKQKVVIPHDKEWLKKIGVQFERKVPESAQIVGLKFIKL